MQMLLDFLIRRQLDRLSEYNGRFIHTNIFYKSIKESAPCSSPLLVIQRTFREMATDQQCVDNNI